jgi:hypothetical protein
MENEKRAKDYLLTGGVVPLLENRHNLILSDELKDILKTIEHAYFAETHYLLQGYKDSDDKGDFFWNVRFVSSDEIESRLKELVKTNRSEVTRPLITFDDVYCPEIADGAYHVTRIMDPTRLDDDPSPGPRMGAEPLEIQARKIAKRFGPEIDILDIGTFGGKTLSDEIGLRFNKEGLQVRDIYLAFAAKEGVERLANENLNVKYLEFVDCVDWLELRDSIGFDGRKIDMAHVPRGDNENHFVRYLERSKKWASIPSEIKDKYEKMYAHFHDLVKRVLYYEGHSVSLSPAATNNGVYILKVN